MAIPPAPSLRLPDANEVCTVSSPNPVRNTHTHPSSWRKPGSRAASVTPCGSGSWVEPRMTEEVGAVCLSRHRTLGRSYYRLNRNDPHPIRHPGERRDPWLRRTRRSRAAITRSATMGPGVRRDDGGGARQNPSRTRHNPPPPSSWRKPGSRAASVTPCGSGSWVEPRMTEEVGAICLSSSRSHGHRGWLTRKNPPPPSSRRKPGPRAPSAPARGPESRFGPK